MPHQTYDGDPGPGSTLTSASAARPVIAVGEQDEELAREGVSKSRPTANGKRIGLSNSDGGPKTHPMISKNNSDGDGDGDSSTSAGNVVNMLADSTPVSSTSTTASGSGATSGHTGNRVTVEADEQEQGGSGSSANERLGQGGEGANGMSKSGKSLGSTGTVVISEADVSVLDDEDDDKDKDKDKTMNEWVAIYHEPSQQHYFVHAETQESLWLPPEWGRMEDDAGIEYFVDHASKETTRHFPVNLARQYKDSVVSDQN